MKWYGEHGVNANSDTTNINTIFRVPVVGEICQCAVILQ